MFAGHTGANAGAFRRQGGISVSRPAGFTLIEAMITLAVLAILASLAAPALQGMIARNRLAAAASDLSAALHLARSEAIRRNASIRFCIDAATGKWKVEVHPDATLLRTGELHQVIGIADDGLDTATVAGHSCVRFRPDGLPYDGTTLIARAADGTGGGRITLSLGGAADRVVGISAGAIHAD